MIIMVNGAFGVGKTTVAEALLKNVDNSMIYDPEIIGFMLRNIIPEDVQLQEAKAGDFQDLKLWTELTVETAARLITRYNRNLIVPMTIRNPDYFQYIFSGLNKWDETIHAFCLTASKETIATRLFNRGEVEGAWCFHQTDSCIDAFERYPLGESISTENVSINAIIEEITQRIRSKEQSKDFDRHLS
ncbi:AAA family ATPase [Bacillus sp. RAR_GA_16]|uniref:AAA family ATPase n=1 Tax=Bacillus sp. RAR_GA_16 TaxID=2876774 RepID=UPI001CCD3DB1|nr:AAA family ATPase [Bacillus sp. RAR_GA_16]MCA0174119.1 zeta toxin family protein [Bacillus sp. RAR_GA_16]